MGYHMMTGLLILAVFVVMLVMAVKIAGLLVVIGVLAILGGIIWWRLRKKKRS